MHPKNFSRRAFLKYTGLVGAGLVLSACTPAGTQAPALTTAPTPRPVTTINWWTPANSAPRVANNQADQEALAAEFNNRPNASVQVEITPLQDDGYSEKMTTALGTGEGVPDVAMLLIADWFPQATDLREYIARDGVDIGMYSKSLFDSRCYYGEKIIGLPVDVGATMYFYNRALFDQKGLKHPEWGYTVQQWMEDAVQLSDPSKKVYGAAMPTRVWRAEFFAFGARPFDDEGKVVEGYMNGPETVAAFEFMWDLAHSGAVPTFSEYQALQTEGTGPIDLFETGRLGFAGLNNGQFIRLDEAGVDYGLVHQPKVDGQEVITNGWTLQIGIPQASQNKDAAWEFLKWYTGVEGQGFLQSRNNGFVACIPTLWDQHPARDDEDVKFFIEIAKTPQVWEFAGRFPYFGQVTRLNQDLYDRIYLGDVERDQIRAELDAVVPQAQEIVDTERAKLGLS